MKDGVYFLLLLETTNLRHLIHIAFFIATIGFTGFATQSHVWPQLFNRTLKKKTLGISIVLYRVGKAEKIEELSDLGKQLVKSRSVNLYKATQDLGIIFMNMPDPYSDTNALPYKLLFGTFVERHVGDTVINGFVSTTEVATMCNWIKKQGVDSFEGFSKLYENLSKEAKQELDDIGADDKASFYTGYVQPLTQFYFAALADKNSIVICGE